MVPSAAFVPPTGLGARSSLGPAISSGESTAARLKLAAAAAASKAAAAPSATAAPISKAALQRAKMAALLEQATQGEVRSASGAWERRDMQELGAKMKGDEVDSMGGLASHSSEVGDRAAMIARINSDTDESLFADAPDRGSSNALGLAAAAAAAAKGGARREVSHHDAMFAPTGAYVPSPSPAPAGPPTAPPPPAAPPPARRVGYLTKLRASAAAAPSAPPSASLNVRFERPPSPRPSEDTGAAAPLWKRLRVGQAVEARSSADGGWYAAEIKQVVHGGYANASFTVQFDDDAREAKSWRDLRLRPDLYPTPDAPASLSALKRPRHSDDVSSGAADGPSSAAPQPAGPTAGATEEPSAAAPPAINPAVVLRAQSGGGWRARAKGLK